MSALPCLAISVDGCRVRLRPTDDGVRVVIEGPNGGVRADVVVRDGSSLRILAAGLAEAAPAEVIQLRPRSI